MSTLPTGYKQLEYIESSGTQYIDTEFKPSSATVVKLKIEGKSTSTEAVFGARNTSGTPTFSMWNISGKLRFDFNTTRYSTTFSYTTLSEIEMKNGLAVVNGQSYTLATASFSISYSMLVFANYTSDSIDPRKGIGKLYYFQIYSSSSLLVRNYIPCKNPSGEVGLYDTVNQKFYGNSGTGNFIAGPEVIVAPDTPGSVSQLTAVALVWGAVECEGYRVYKNGSAIATTTQPNYVDYAVGDGQTIEYAITAFNGEYESDSVSVSVTVKEGYTSLIPVINSAFFQ